MRVDFEDGGVFRDIVKEIESIPGVTQEYENMALKKIGAIIKDNVRDNIPIEYEQALNYDGSAPRIHMANDLKVKIKHSKEGYSSVTVMGGRLTAYKWHLLDDGTRDSQGRVHTPAIHFTTKALKASESDIDAIIEGLIQEVASNDGS